MKRTITYISSALLLIVGLCISCQKEQNFSEENGAPVNEVIVKATIGSADTKVSFTEDATNNKLKAAWEEIDHILGWDKDGNAIELKIASIDNGTAIFKKAEGSEDIPTSGKVYMIYAPGKNKSNISSSSLEYDLSNQNGNKIPALMTATGEVEDNVLELTFANQLAIVAVKNPTFPVTEETAITGLKLSGSNILTKATFSMDDEALKMEPSEEGDIARGCSFTTEADGTTTETMVYFAVLPNSTAADVTVSTTAPEGYKITFPDKSFTAGQCYMLENKGIEKQNFTVSIADGIGHGSITTNPAGECAWGETVTVTVSPDDGYMLATLTYNDGSDHDIKGNKSFMMPQADVTVSATFEEISYVTINGIKWCTMNLGANTVNDYGKLYSWGNLNGQSGNSFSPSFTYANYSGTEGGGVSSATDWDKEKHDAAYNELGGNWRIPTNDDFVSLDEACNGNGRTGQSLQAISDESIENGKVKKGRYWLEANQAILQNIEALKDITAAGLLFSDGENYLFFPAAGYGENTSPQQVGASGHYWSSTYNTHKNAYGLRFDSGFVNQLATGAPYLGFSVRPVSD